MAVYYFQDDVNVRTNSVTVVNGCGPSYNAVISKPVFSGEATTEPILLPEAKIWCKLDDDTTDDALVTRLIKAAREICENHAVLSFITRTVSVRIVNGLGGIELPYGPVNNITAVTDFYQNSILTGFSLDTPYCNPITITYTAGYTTLPESLRTAVINQLTWMYANRGDVKLASVLCLESMLILNQVRSV